MNGAWCAAGFFLAATIASGEFSNLNMAAREPKASRNQARAAAAPRRQRPSKPAPKTNRRAFSPFRPRPRPVPLAPESDPDLRPPGMSVPRIEVPTPAEDAARARTPYDGESAIKLYLREIGQVPLLTPAQEVELAAKIHRGDKAARELMIKANLRLVVKIAHDYDWLGMPLLDLINEGNIGLMKAVERFDPKKGGKLSTYGAWWIKQSIKRALANQGKTIRLPVHLVDKISKMRRVAMQLQEEFGREPTDEELGEAMEMTASRVAQLRTAAIRPASLDAPVGDEGDSHLFGDIIEDEQAETPYEQLEEKTVTSMLRDMVKTLPPREATILTFRFGLDGGSERTLEEVGQKFGVTRERVRQIQNIALRKLRRMIERRESQKV